MKNGFLQHTAASIVSRFGWDKLQQLTLVFPSRRAGIVLKEALKEMQKEQHSAPVLLPNITTLNDVFDSLSPLYKEDELLLIFRMYHIYADVVGKPISPDIFYGWGQQLLADFNNIEKSITSDEEIGRFFANTVEAKQLEELEIDEEVQKRLNDLLREHNMSDSDGSIRQSYTLLWQNMYTIYQRLNAELNAEQKGYEGMRMRRVITDWSNLHEHYDNRTFIFIGFNYLMPIEKELMRLLYDQKQAYFYWDYMDDFEANEKAYSFIKQHINDFQNATLSHAEQWTKRPISLISATSANAQAQYAGQWLRKKYTHKGQSTAIVICDEQMLEPVIYALSPITPQGSGEPELVNITKGFPLSGTQIYADVMTYLADRHHDCKEGETYGDLLLRLIEAVITPAEQAARKTAQDDPKQEESWQWLLIQESLYQTRLIINQLHRILQDPAMAIGQMSLHLLRTLLQRCLSSVSLPFHGEPITDIQVMGVLETRLLDFENLLLLNVEEGIVPQKQSDFSFIPYYLRKAYHIQTREESASVYAYNFFRLLSRADDTTLIFSESATQMGHKTMSRFVMQMLVNPKQFEITKYTLTENNHLRLTPLLNLSNNQQNLLSNLKIGSTGKLQYENGGTFTLSPSAINTYIGCKRHFYLQYILDIRHEDPETLIFAKNTLGSFVHSAMEHIYKDMINCSPERNTLIDAEVLKQIKNTPATIEKALDAAYTAQNQEYAKHHQDDPQHYIKEAHPMENEVIKGFIANILERDIEDAEKRGLRIRLLEQKRYFDIDLDDDLGTVQVGGTIDRLDMLGDEIMRVVDYKSGSYSEKKLSTTWDKLLTDKDAKYILQTFIYSEAVEQNDHKNDSTKLQPTLYYPQRKLTSNNTQTCVAIGEKKGMEVSDYCSESVREQFVPLLTEKVKEILTTTDFPQVEKENDCGALYCPFLQICDRHPVSFN